MLLHDILLHSATLYYIMSRYVTSCYVMLHDISITVKFEYASRRSLLPSGYVGNVGVQSVYVSG